MKDDAVNDLRNKVKDEAVNDSRNKGKDDAVKPTDVKGKGGPTITSDQWASLGKNGGEKDCEACDFCDGDSVS